MQQQMDARAREAERKAQARRLIILGGAVVALARQREPLLDFLRREAPKTCETDEKRALLGSFLDSLVSVQTAPSAQRGAGPASADR